jgi:Zn-dependent M16 (insulinase) family peptidase
VRQPGRVGPRALVPGFGTAALLLILALAMAGPTSASPRQAAAAPAGPRYETLQAGDRVLGFEASAVYLDASEQPMGARFVHRPTGFELHLLQIESVPQAFTWVRTFAPGDQGEPHTQEHLLLLRGTRGRTLATRQVMSLAAHSAYTETWRTSYFFNTSAGVDAFFDLYAEQQRALLHPDYSDAEIRLEVRNFGVTRAGEGALRLEEKGTVYNEMVASMAGAGWQAWRARNHAVYGTRHPLAFNQGGEPAGIRTMTPQDIRRFHAATHHLANMGTVAAFPRSVPLARLLERFHQVLMKDAPRDGRPRPADTLAQLPPPAGDPEGALRLYDYPHFNAEQPSPASLVWPAERRLDATEQLLAELFFANLAGDSTSNLYRLLIDGRERKLDSGARSISAFVARWGGHPVSIDLGGLRPAAMGDEGLRALRQLVVDEIARIAAWPDGSAELAAFNERIAGRISAREREARKFLGTPPGFGARGGRPDWVELLTLLERSEGTRKSLVLAPEFARLRQALAGGRNLWRERLERWRISGRLPYLTGARPNPALIAREQAERQQRLEQETSRLMRRYGTDDEQLALQRFAAESEAELARIDRDTRVPPTPFVATPPLTLDDGLQFETIRLGPAPGVPLVASRFASMTGAMTGLALRLDGVPRELLPYLSLLPSLLSEVGMQVDGQPLSHEQVRERQRREILSLSAGFATGARTGRVELVLRAAGTGAQESGHALAWLERALMEPDWRLQNLPRLRDVVEQQLAALRNTLQRPEESWVHDPFDAWRHQHQPAWLAAASFQTRTHHALRLRWQLIDPAPEDAQPLAAFLSSLAEAGRQADRAALGALLKAGQAPGWPALTAAQQALAAEALRDLELSLSELPDASLGADFAQLATGLRDDLLLPAEQALARLHELRRLLLRTGGARLFMAAPPALAESLQPRLQALVARLDPTPFVPQPRESEGLVQARLRGRGVDTPARHVGLHAPNKQGGVVLTAVPMVHYADAGDRERLLDYLSTRLYAGGGSHGVFSKTVGAGLAYSNGLRGSVSSGVAGYYAERTPELPQTVRFVIDIVRGGKPGRELAEYVMAQAFTESRAAMSYEARAEGIAADLADGQPPAMVRRFRQALLALRAQPQLVEQLAARKDRVHARLLPGYAAGALDHERGHFMVIGPPRQLDAWAQHLRESAGAAGAPAVLTRLYGRDFWLP